MNAHAIDLHEHDIAGDIDVSPTTAVRDTRSTDASKLSFPLQLVIAIVVGCVTIVGGQAIMDRGQNLERAKIQSDVRDILTRMEYEATLRDISDKALNARFDALEAQIESAGLRNAAMSMSQELQRKGR